MLLAIDIGNTLTKFGFFENETLHGRTDIPTNRSDTADTIDKQLFVHPVHAIVISSVVPELKKTYLEFAEKHFKLAPFFVDNSFDFGLKIKYVPPANLGVDRIVAAFAAVEKYDSPCIICDFGTATTIDAVNSKNEFLGGIIAPGMKLLSEALYLKTSKLPRIEIRKPVKVIGNSTINSIESGIYFGYIGLVDGLIERMTGELGEKPAVVATGGFAGTIAETSELIGTVDKNLMLEGLRLIYEKHVLI